MYIFLLQIIFILSPLLLTQNTNLPSAVPPFYSGTTKYEPSPLMYNRPNNPLQVNTKRGPKSIKCIVLDPGHGGKDMGCHHNALREKEISLQLSLRLRDLIKEQYPDLKVILTRDRDVFVPLHQRAKIANDHHADLFISIHCNSAPKNTKAQGTETYVLGLHRAEDNLAVAKRENASILLEENYHSFYGGFDPNAPETHIILSMFQNSFLEQSIVLAHSIEQECAKTRNSRGVKQAGFAVLRLTTMPSVLFEAGFLSNSADAKYLATPSTQAILADQLLRAFRRYVEMMYPEQIMHSAVAKNQLQALKDQNLQNQAFYTIQLANTSKAIKEIPKKWSALGTVLEIKKNKQHKYVLGQYINKEQAFDKLVEVKNSIEPMAFVTRITSEDINSSLNQN